MATQNGTFKNINKSFNYNSKHSSEYLYVMAFKNEFDRKLFPDNFDNWTVHERCIWINENIARFFPNVPQSLLHMIPALFSEGDFDRSPEKKPEWLDMEKYHRGRKFVHDNYFSVVLSKILGILCIYTFNDGLKPLIVSRGSYTPYLAFKRYISTVNRFFHWYDEKPWVKGTQAYNDIQYVHKMHLMMRKKLCEMDNQQIDEASTFTKPWCPDRELLLRDFAAACPFENPGQCPYTLFEKSPYRPKGINNGDFAITQCSFISLLLLCPQYLGLHNETDEDLEAFCHMWRCYGYYLGIKDEYNFCRGSLEEIKQRVRDMYQYWITPNLKNITPEWEHITRCIVEAINFIPFIYIPYKVTTLIATDILNINMPHLYASLSYVEWFAYKAWTFILRHIMKFSILRRIVNKVICKQFNKAVNFGPKEQAELQKKSKSILPHSPY